MACLSGFGADGPDPSAPNTSSSQALEAPPAPRGRSTRIDGRSAPNDPALSATRFADISGVRPHRPAIRPDRAVGLGFRHQVPERTAELRALNNTISQIEKAFGAGAIMKLGE